MARGNSKLFRIHLNTIKVLDNIHSNFELEQAFIDGYTFVTNAQCTEVRMISTNCSKTSMKVELINADVVMDDNVKELRI
jgi:hypothetical protein